MCISFVSHLNQLFPLQLVINPQVVILLVSGTHPNAGDLNYFPLDANGISFIAIIISITLLYTDNIATDPTAQETLVYEMVIEPADWIGAPCSYLQDNCAAFQSGEILIFAPDAPGGFATLSPDALSQLTANSDINIVSNTCDIRCQDDVCNGFDLSLVPSGNGIGFGTPVQPTFNNGFCNPSIFDDSHVIGLRDQRYDWYGEDGGWYAFLSTQDQLQMNLRVTSHLPQTFPERQLVNDFAVATAGDHTITVEIMDPLDLAPSCLVRRPLTLPGAGLHRRLAW